MKVFKFLSLFSSKRKIDVDPHPLSIESNIQIARLLLVVAKYALVINCRKDQIRLYDVLEINVDQMIEDIDKRLWITELANWIIDHIGDEPCSLVSIKDLTHSWKNITSIESSLYLLTVILGKIRDITGDETSIYCGSQHPQNEDDVVISYQLTLEGILSMLARRDDIFIQVDIQRAKPVEIDYALFKEGIYCRHSENYIPSTIGDVAVLEAAKYKPTTDWEHGGPLFDRFNLEIIEHDDGLIEVSPMHETGIPRCGPTRLIAACRSVHANVTNRKIPKIPLSIVIRRDIYILIHPIKSANHFDRTRGLGVATRSGNNIFQEI